jgi:RNA exonuclease 4
LEHPHPTSSTNCDNDDTAALDDDSEPDMKNGESLQALRSMIHGHPDSSYTPSQKQFASYPYPHPIPISSIITYLNLIPSPGKYLALDCEMVGVGIDGVESSLARVSLVNYHGVVMLDEFVRQRERVVDWRTEFSGVREGDMRNGMYVISIDKNKMVYV